MHWDIFVVFQKTYLYNILIFLSTYIGTFNWYFIKIKKKWNPILALNQLISCYISKLTLQTDTFGFVFWICFVWKFFRQFSIIWEKNLKLLNNFISKFQDPTSLNITGTFCWFFLNKTAIKKLAILYSFDVLVLCYRFLIIWE